MEEDQTIIHYQDVIDLGFKVERPGDTIFHDQYGFEWMIVQKELFIAKKYHIVADWSCVERRVEIVHFKRKDGSRIRTISNVTLEELKIVIAAFKLHSKKLDKTEKNFTPQYA